MATNLQRSQAIVDAANDKANSQAVLARVAEGLLSESPEAFAALSAAEQAAIIPTKIREHIVREVLQYEEEQRRKAAAAQADSGPL